MSSPKQQKPKPIFHEAAEAPKPEFQPHHVGAADPSDEISAQEPEHVEEVGTSEEPVHKTEENVRVLPHGWRVLTLEQQTGATFLVTHDLEAEGIPAFWRKTRALSHYKWVLNGKWSNTLTRLDILPEPRYYKEMPI